LAHFDFDIVSDFDIRISDFSLSARPSCPACHAFMSQLCKTNPILQTTKPPQHLIPHRFTAISRSAPPPKNKPNQTQFPAPCCAGKESRISERNACPDLSGGHQRSRIQCRESRIEYRVSKIQHHCAKQSQCQNGQYRHKHSNNKGLWQRTMNNEHYPKQTQSNPIFPAPPKPPLLIFEQISNSPRRIRPRTSSIVHRYL